MVDKSELAIATSQPQNPILFLIELSFNLLSQIITIPILWVVVAKFHTEKVWENQIFDHLQKI